MNNKNVRTIASVMIVLLAVLLIIIFISFNNREYNKPYIMHSSGESIVKKQSGDASKVINNEAKSGEFAIEESSGDYEIDMELNNSGDTSGDDNIEDSGELVSGDKVAESSRPSKKPIRNSPPKQSSNESQIIVSRTETSNQEKQEVLNEIDDALKGLLEAVGKVKTVDESKLDASLESEVEP